MTIETGTQSLKVAVVQMCSSTDVSDNLAFVEQLAKEAWHKGAEWLVLPEYFPLFAKREQDKMSIVEKAGSGPIQHRLEQLACQYKLWIFAGSMPIASGDVERPFSRLSVYNNKGLQCAHYDKIHLFDVDVDDGHRTYRESANTLPGDQPVSCDTPWGKVGLAICYDIRFPELFRVYAEEEVAFVVLPAAFTVTTGRAHWEVLLRARAIENQCFILAAAQSGRHQNGRETWGHSMIIDPWGDTVAELEQESGLLICELDIHRLTEVRSQMPVLTHRQLKQN
ncbi:carbon-nitrogen hydrolase family protein [Pleionea sp. CnH1-48]|uniref:carbon-nitrogen hydrolase family protein n=1 Tax=Pleionea sp. CnH1-48 TaxID=2954494 RepID=UPI0020969C72|nr:carbon-nitrogen hydrolase family protein [Pleionea sp. CnH1-48]MCO7224056.1 carbon-nitrogen hydrolase family protein [Pleionea sp. CnH1-48]